MLRAAVIGAGRIGCGLDAPGTATPLTHAGGYAAHPGFSLVALCDANPGIAQCEATRWGCAPATDIAAMLRDLAPDVISVCAPTAQHAALLEKLLAYRPKAVVAEKPLSDSVDSARDLVASYEQAGIPLIVHFTRRFIPLYQEVRQRILAEGQALTASIKYAKGLTHNGAHAMDLALAMFGPVLSMRALAARKDFFDKDPTVAAHLSCERCRDVHYQILDERAFTHFEFDVILSSGRYTFYKDDFAALAYEVSENTLYKCKSLLPVGEVDTGKMRAMLTLMDNVLDTIHDRAKPLCTGRDGLAAQKLCAELERMVGDAAS